MSKRTTKLVVTQKESTKIELKPCKGSRGATKGREKCQGKKNPEKVTSVTVRLVDVSIYLLCGENISRDNSI